MATIILPRSLIAMFPAAPRRCDVEATTVAEAIDRLDELAPGMRNRIVDAGPSIREHIKARDIVSAIHLASRGMHVLPRSAAAGGGVDQLGSDGTELTAREAEVLELLQDGRTNAEIATELSIGVETVRTHARNIYRKLGIASRRELSRLARSEPVVQMVRDRLVMTLDSAIDRVSAMLSRPGVAIGAGTR